MKKTTLILFIIFGLTDALAQVEQNIYELNSMKNLLTKDVKAIIDINLKNRKVVFLGEAEHHIGSDFLAKTEFVKYLVKEHNYKDIAFESDFFGLYFEHNKRNIFSHWSLSVQCKELFEFLKENNVTLWGFDNQFLRGYTYENFTLKLSHFLDVNHIKCGTSFIPHVRSVIKNGSDVKKKLKVKEIASLISELDILLNNGKVKNNPLWYQIIESFKSTVLIYSTHSKISKGIPVRDKQMAKNLDFLVKTNPHKKFIVWLANAHMSKLDHKAMKGKTMGNQFIKLNPDISYHIAVASIKMPYRKDKWLQKSFGDQRNFLHFLPSIENNYFIDSKSLINSFPEFRNKKYVCFFGVEGNKTNWFEHFDALVFISKGEKVKYPY